MRKEPLDRVVSAYLKLREAGEEVECAWRTACLIARIAERTAFEHDVLIDLANLDTIPEVLT